MTQKKVPKHLRGKLERTGYGYISKDYLYRIFLYKKTFWYYTKEPQRWLLLRPDSKVEYFETLMAARERIHELQQQSAVEREKKRLMKQLKERDKKLSEQKEQKKKAGA